MEEVIIYANTRFTVPDGFDKVLPVDCVPGELVYIVGTYEGRPWAYGPFTVVDPTRFRLTGPRRQFCDRSSHWLRKVNKV